MWNFPCSQHHVNTQEVTDFGACWVSDFWIRDYYCIVFSSFCRGGKQGIFFRAVHLVNRKNTWTQPTEHMRTFHLHVKALPAWHHRSGWLWILMPPPGLVSEYVHSQGAPSIPVVLGSAEVEEQSALLKSRVFCIAARQGQDELAVSKELFLLPICSGLPY